MRYETDLDTSGSDFTWSVARRGYALVEKSYKFNLGDAIEFGEQPFSERSGLAFHALAPSPLATCKTAADFDTWRKDEISDYRPGDCAALHRAFVDCESRAEAALQFVNRFGLLERRPAYPSFLGDFFSAQAMIRDILALAKRQRASDSKVQEAINRNKAHFFLRVTPTGKGKLIQRVVPETLLGWMLLQSVHELTGTTYRDCEVCGKTFKVRDERQGRQRFCSDRCRQKNFREQRRR